MARINILWAIPVLLPFALVAAIRLLWVMVGVPWEPDAEFAGGIVLGSLALSYLSVGVVGLLHAEEYCIWWTVKKEKSDA